MIDFFKSLFTLFMGVCRFQRGPQDLPSSRSFLSVLIFISAILALFLNLFNFSFREAALAVILNLAVVIIITQLILRLYNKPMRLIQTLTAQMGAGIVISIFAIPVIVMLHYAKTHNVDLFVSAILWMVLFSWELAVTAHILRHALSTTFLQGSLMAILYPLIYFQLIDYLIPTMAVSQ